MILNRTKNTVRGISTGIVNKIVTILLPFFVRTLLIRKIGIEYAGLSGLFVSVLQVLNLAELGFSDAVVHSMYKPVAEDDEDAVCALLSFYRRIYAMIGGIIFAVGLLLLPLLPKLIHGAYPADINLYLLYFIYLFDTCISYLFFGYKTAVLNAFQRKDMIYNASTLTKVCLNVAQIILLLTTQNYYLYAAVIPISTILNNLLISHEVKSHFPQYICKGMVSATIKKEMKKKVSGLMIQKVCAAARDTFDNIFISAFLGLTVTAMYSNYYYVMSAVGGFMRIITDSMLSGIGNGIQLETKEENYKKMRKFNFMYMWISVWLTTALFCLYQPFIQWWVGKEYLLDFKMVILLCFYFYALRIGTISYLYYSAAGLWWEGKGRAFMEALTNLLLNFILVQKMGIYGIVLATLISLLCVNFLYGGRFVFRYYFGMEKLREYYMLHGLYFTVLLLCAVSTYAFCYFCVGVLEIDQGFYALMVKGIICVVVPNFILWIVYRKTEQFHEMCCWIKRYRK